MKKKPEKFHDALLKILYPPPSPSPSQEKEEEEKNKKLIETEIYYYNNLISQDLENEKESPAATNSSSSSSSTEHGNGKLTRAQRKRLRKKKLKENASQRRKIIGPLLPSSEDDENINRGVDLENLPVEGVRQNAAEGANSRNDSSGDIPASCSKQNKLKQRRKSKKFGGTSNIVTTSASIEVEDHQQGEANDERIDS